MSKTLSYVLVTPYTIAKSRTGGVLSRLLLRTDLELVGAQLFAPSGEFVREYSLRLRSLAPPDQRSLLADYIERNLAPAGDGRPHRTLFLLFAGENPAEKLAAACGHIYSRDAAEDVNEVAGETIRDTYADLIPSRDDPNEVTYFEPAVLTPRNQKEADEDMALFSRYLNGSENIAQDAAAAPSKAERTLVIIKPDNWTYNSSRPGAIMDMFSRTGLRIIGLKVHRFSLAQALEFYGPVEGVLVEKLSPVYAKKAQNLLEKEFGFALGAGTKDLLEKSFGPECARNEFYSIVEFMAGKRPGKRPGKCPGSLSKEELEKPGDVKCMILVYEGENAVSKIRDVLGPTDPSKAPEGTVRKEFGSNIMVNTAHASDSAESYERERVIVELDENTALAIMREYLGG